MWTSTTKLLIAKNRCCRPVNNGKGYQSCVSGAATRLLTGRHDLRRGRQTVSARRQGLSTGHHDLCAHEQALSAGAHRLSMGPTRMRGGLMIQGTARLEGPQAVMERAGRPDLVPWPRSGSEVPNRMLPRPNSIRTAPIDTWRPPNSMWTPPNRIRIRLNAMWTAPIRMWTALNRIWTPPISIRSGPHHILPAATP